MAQAGYTPIITYHSTTGAAVPDAANLSPGELALNIADMKLYCENASGTVTLLADAGVLDSPLEVVGNSTAGAEIRLPEDTDNGSNYVALKAPDSLSSNFTCTLPDETCTLGFRNIPAIADKTAAYTLATGDVGKVVGVGSGGSIEIPDATFAAGDAVLVFNNTTGDVTITCTITTAYIAGADADVASVTLATRGVCNILFISGTACVLTGNIS